MNKLIIYVVMVFFLLIPVNAVSTVTITLGTADIDVLEDTYIRAGVAKDDNFGTYSNLQTGTRFTSPPATPVRAYIKFNITTIPTFMNISDAELCMYEELNMYESGNNPVLQAYQLNNQTWDELNPSFNNNMSTNYGSLIASNASIGVNAGWTCLNVTEWVNTTYKGGNVNVSFLINSTETMDTENDIIQFTSKEGSTTANRPYLKVTYESTPPRWYNNQTLIPFYYNPGNNTYFNVSWNVTYSGLSTAWIEGNWSGSPVNYSMENITYTLGNYSYNETLPGGTFYFKSCANSTANNWNCTDKYVFNITANQTNYCHINFTYGSATYPDTNVTVYTITNVLSEAWCTGTSGDLYSNGIMVSNPLYTTHLSGIYFYSVNTTGDNNYAANVTGLNITLTAIPYGGTIPSTPTPSGGGGGAAPSIIYMNLSNVTVPQFNGTLASGFESSLFSPEYYGFSLFTFMIIGGGAYVIYYRYLKYRVKKGILDYMFIGGLALILMMSVYYSGGVYAQYPAQVFTVAANVYGTALPRTVSAEIAGTVANITYSMPAFLADANTWRLPIT